MMAVGFFTAIQVLNSGLNALLSGHFVPSKTSWRKFLAAYMRDSTVPHPSPSAVPESGPSSGTATPTGGLDYKHAVMMKL